MQLTRQADYGARTVLYLSTTQMASTAEIASAQSIPREYLFKIIQLLARSGIISTHRGAWGGVSLARSPEEITLLDVFEAIEGPLAINRCLVKQGDCPREAYCSIHDELFRVQASLRRALAETNFARLAHQEQANRETKGTAKAAI